MRGLPTGQPRASVVVAWDAVDGAAFYRIGWVAMDDIPAVRAEGREWLDAFVFADVANRGQTAYTITGLVPGRDYAFIVASVAQRFGAGAWSGWAYLTPAGVASCPAGGGGEPTPEPPVLLRRRPRQRLRLRPTLATPAPTPTPTPASTPIAAGVGGRSYDADGDGLIEVSNLAQLAAIRADLNGDGASPAPAYAAAFPEAMVGMGCPSGCTGYELVADLDFDTNGNGAADEGDAYWNDGAGWIPIGDAEHTFTADFDGNNHTIANLYINRRGDDYVGLFGYVSGSSSSIKQVGIVSVAVFGRQHIGGLAGQAGGSTISDSYVTGSVSGSYQVGGLVGWHIGGTISGSYVTGSVSGGGDVGGLVGWNYYGGTISGSYVTGSVSGSGGDIGGLVGKNQSGAITASYVTGSVSGDGDDIGGLVGRNLSGTITASYAAGRVSTSGDTFYIGGLVGYEVGSAISDSYWDMQASGQGSSYGGVGQTTAELQSPTGYAGIYADWNLDLDGDGEGDEPWDFGGPGQYPALRYGGLDVGAQRR